MAVPMGVFSSFFAGGTLSSVKSSSCSVNLIPVKLHLVRTVTVLAAASKPAVKAKNQEPKGILKPLRVSPEMQAFLGGVSEIPRPQVLKEIWVYIKQHNLQDPSDKKVIVCDEKLKEILGGKDRVGFLEIAGLISPHFLKQ